MPKPVALHSALLLAWHGRSASTAPRVGLGGMGLAVASLFGDVLLEIAAAGGHARPDLSYGILTLGLRFCL